MSKFNKDSLGNRMKRYEDVNRHFLSRRTPVIIRLDGKAFHSFTKGLDRPFDEDLHKTFKQTLFELVSQIQGAVFAYTQSDEISILLRDWDTLTTDAWFDYNVQKMASVSASIATAEFNIFNQIYIRTKIRLNRRTRIKRGPISTNFVI